MKKLLFLLLGTCLVLAVPVESNAEPEKQEKNCVFKECSNTDFASADFLIEYDRDVIFISDLESQNEFSKIEILKEGQKINQLHFLINDRLLRHKKSKFFFSSKIYKNQNTDFQKQNLILLPDDKLLERKRLIDHQRK